MLVDMQTLLQRAYENQFAVGAYNVHNSEFVNVIIDAAEAQNSPAILQIHPMQIDFMGDAFVSFVREAIANTKVPMALHLDHGANMFDVMRGIKNGYNSVMIDASTSSYEENVAITKQVVEVAHTIGVAVEAELGTIGSNEGSAEGGTEDILYTNPQQAAEFVERTGIDCLAVAVGTSHGIYPDTKDHSIKIGRLQAICKEVSIPLVLHGGSDNADEEIRESTQNGVAKINLASDMNRALYKTLKESMIAKPTVYESCFILAEARKAATEVVMQKMDLFGSTGKMDLYR